MSVEEKAGLIINMVEKSSKSGAFFTQGDIPSENLGITEEEFQDVLLHVLQDERIATLDGKGKQYLYAKLHMTEHYAHLLLDIVEKNLGSLLAGVVRRESQIFPRPTLLETFLSPPYQMTREVLQTTLNAMQTEYEDIRTFTAKNGEQYLFSTQYLSEDYAKSLADWIDIVQNQTP